MTNRLKSTKSIAQKVGRVKNRIFITVIALLGTTFLLDIFVVDKIFGLLAYLYIALGALFVLYVIPLFYASRRLIQYYWQRARKNRLAVGGLAFIIFLILLAIIGPFFTADPTAANFEEKNLPPVGFTLEESVYDLKTEQFITTTITGTGKHPIGTDDKGRDLLAMIISGAWVSLQVGLFATGIAIALGTLIGVTAAYLGGKMDNILMRFTDIMMTFPFFLLLVLLDWHRPTNQE
ncbi:hypothetical protein ES703_103741 [subsurface metagenome]